VILRVASTGSVKRSIERGRLNRQVEPHNVSWGSVNERRVIYKQSVWSNVDIEDGTADRRSQDGEGESNNGGVHSQTRSSQVVNGTEKLKRR
jgi:hypothetical protein